MNINSINNLLCQDPATFISEIGSSTDMTQSIFEAHLILTATQTSYFSTCKQCMQDKVLIQVSVFTAFHSVQKHATAFDIYFIHFYPTIAKTAVELFFSPDFGACNDHFYPQVRGLLSLLNAASRPSVESAGQTAFGAPIIISSMLVCIC